MRMLLKAVFDTDAANEVIGSGHGAEVNRRMDGGTLAAGGVLRIR
jgi:hypothetical protein